MSKVILPLSLAFCLLLFILPSGCGDIEGVASSLTVSPAKVSVGVNQSQLFTAVARDSEGLRVEIEPSWSVSGGIGTITANGLFIAGDAVGSGSVVASSETVQGSAAVTVTENGKISGQVTSATLGYGSGIKVYLNEAPGLLDLADSRGFYEITDVPVGTYFVTTQVTDVFQSASKEVTVGRGETRSGVNLTLQTQPGMDFSTTTTTLPF